MNDRELLELAAKAAGLREPTEINGRFAVRVRDAGLQDWSPWNPLTDDGDALRLAVKLRLDVRVNSYDTLSYQASNYLARAVAETHEGDPCTATRRAIVRAAAEIGRSMT